MNHCACVRLLERVPVFTCHRSKHHRLFSMLSTHSPGNLVHTGEHTSTKSEKENNRGTAAIASTIQLGSIIQLCRPQRDCNAGESKGNEVGNHASSIPDADVCRDAGVMLSSPTASEPSAIADWTEHDIDPLKDCDLVKVPHPDPAAEEEEGMCCNTVGSTVADPCITECPDETDTSEVLDAEASEVVVMSGTAPSETDHETATVHCGMTDIPLAEKQDSVEEVAQTPCKETEAQSPSESICNDPVIATEVGCTLCHEQHLPHQQGCCKNEEEEAEDEEDFDHQIARFEREYSKLGILGGEYCEDAWAGGCDEEKREEELTKKLRIQSLPSVPEQTHQHHAAVHAAYEELYNAVPMEMVARMKDAMRDIPEASLFGVSTIHL